jgi:hypothetical protein
VRRVESIWKSNYSRLRFIHFVWHRWAAELFDRGSRSFQGTSTVDIGIRDLLANFRLFGRRLLVFDDDRLLLVVWRRFFDELRDSLSQP